jgi:CHASE2 domain-containing sensor protein
LTAFIQKRYDWLINRLFHRCARFVTNRKNLLLLGIIAGSFLLVCLLTEILLPATFTTWNSQLNDSFFRLRQQLTGKRKTSPYLVHAVINDSSFRTLNLTYGDRSIYGRVLETLKAAGVTAVACDIFFSDNFYPENDQWLIRATQDFKAAGGAIYYPLILQPGSYPVAKTETADNRDPDALEPRSAALLARNLWHPKIIKTGRRL